MSTLQKSILAFFGTAALLGGLAWFGFTPFREVVTQMTAAVGSPVGTTNDSAKAAEQIVSDTSSTTVSILNTDASDRTIVNFDGMLKGGTSTSTSYNIACATSSSATTGLGGNTNYVLNMTIAPNATVLGTTTGAGTFIASSSPGLTGTSTTQGGAAPNIVNPYVRNWAAGSYLNCVVGTTGGSNTNLFDSGITGFLSFPYRGQ